jgi:hypothetical protein
MFPIDPNAPGGSDRSLSLRRSYLDHTLVRERLPTFTFSQTNPARISRSVLPGRPTAAARQAGTMPGAEPVPRAAVNRIALSHRADRSPAPRASAVVSHLR